MLEDTVPQTSIIETFGTAARRHRSSAKIMGSGLDVMLHREFFYIAKTGEVALRIKLPELLYRAGFKPNFHS